MKFKIFGFDFYISKSHAPSIPPDKLLFDRVQLGGLLRPYFDNGSSLLGIILSQLSILITIGLTLLVSDVTSKWGIDKSLWIAFILFTSGILGAWSIYVFYRFLRSPNFDDFLSSIIPHSQTVVDRRFVFIFRAKGSDNSRLFLTQFIEEWDCWMLPNFGRSMSSKMNTDHELLDALSEKLALKQNSLIGTPVREDLINTKFSERNRKLTTYYFDFYSIKIPSSELPEIMLDKEFDVAGGKFSWMTIDEMKRHKLTSERNGDVIKHLENSIPNASVPLSIDHPVTCS